MFYLFVSILTIGGFYLLLNGEWVFHLHQNRAKGRLATLVFFLLAVGWDVARPPSAAVLPDLYPLVAVAAGMFMGTGQGAVAGAKLALASALLQQWLHGGAGLAGAFILSLVLFIFIGAITGRFSDRMRTMAFTDSLTGLPNRRYFFEELEAEVARALRYRFPLSILIIDLDYFKSYNDRLGHVAGDIALKRLSDMLRTGSREGDIMARYGGEEFIVALSHTDTEAARLYADRLRENVQALYGHGPVQLTVSVGIASLPGYSTLDALVQAADAALYQAKEGRNRVVVAPPSTRSA
ncbi:MAG: GGDEF domain-containing protein [Bacillota bacterium]